MAVSDAGRGRESTGAVVGSMVVDGGVGTQGSGRDGVGGCWEAVAADEVSEVPRVLRCCSVFGCEVVDRWWGVSSVAVWDPFVEVD